MLGQEVQDTVTGFKGIATVEVKDLNGRIRYCVKPRGADNKFPDGQYIDAEQLIVIGDGVVNG